MRSLQRLRGNCNRGGKEIRNIQEIEQPISLSSVFLTSQYIILLQYLFTLRAYFSRTLQYIKRLPLIIHVWLYKFILKYNKNLIPQSHQSHIKFSVTVYGWGLLCQCKYRTHVSVIIENPIGQWSSLIAALHNQCSAPKLRQRLP